MKLYLLRHGKRGHGEKQDTLTSLGIEQAKRTAKHFKNIKIDKIICGDSQRTRETTKPIVNLLGSSIEYTSEVTEQKLGILEGKSSKEWKEAVKKSGLPENEFRPDEGENRCDAYERAKKFYERLKEEDLDNILIVSHAGFISDLITLIFNISMEESSNFKTQNCSISLFELDTDFKVKGFLINDIIHLARESPYL